MELTPKQKNRLLAAADIVENGELAVIHKLIEFENTLENNTEKIDEAVSNAQQVGQGIIKEVQELKEEAQETLKSIRQPQDGHTPTDNELKALIVPLIPKVKDGKTPTPEEIISLIRPLIPEPKNGVSPTKEELISLIKQVIPDQTPEEIRDKLESLEGEERLDAAAIKNLPKLIESTELWRGGGGSRFLSQMLDLRITDPVSGDLLQYNNGYWTNTAFDNNGILSLNGLTGATQVFSVANGIAVNSSGTTHALSLGAITPSSVSVGNGTAVAPSYSFASNTGTGLFISGNSVRVSRSGTVQAQIGGGTQGIINLPATGGIGWTADADVVTVDTFLLRDAANTLAQRNGTNNQVFRMYGKYANSGTDYERLNLSSNGSSFDIFAQSGGTGVNRPLRLGVNGSVMWQINTSGHLTAVSDNAYDIGASGATRPRNLYVGTLTTSGQGFKTGNGYGYSLGAYGQITSAADGIFTLYDNAATSFTQLNFGGTTSSFPTINKSGTQLRAMLADLSGYAGFRANYLQLNSGSVLRSVTDGEFTIRNSAETVVATVTGTLTTAYTAVGTTAVTTEEDLWTYSLPAGALNADGRGVRIIAWGTFAANANNKTVKVYFGATNNSSASYTTAPNGTLWKFTVDILRGSATTQFGSSLFSAGGLSGTNIMAPTETLSGAVTIKVTGQNGTAVANDIVFRGGYVETIK